MKTHDKDHKTTITTKPGKLTIGVELSRQEYNSMTEVYSNYFGKNTAVVDGDNDTVVVLNTESEIGLALTSVAEEQDLADFNQSVNDSMVSTKH